MGIRGADSTQLFELSYSFPHSHIRGKVMALFQLIYMSTLATDEPDILHGILDSSVRNNPRKNITGMMLYSEGSVLQVLEGEKDDVLELFRVIERDVRHSGIYLLIESEISTRNFSSWSMGFRRLSQADLAKFPAAAQVFKARTNELALRVQPGTALIVLKSFIEDSMGMDS